jgi:hypothetical protein
MKAQRKPPTSVDELRSRVRSLHGDPLPKTIVAEGMAKLERGLAERFAMQHAHAIQTTEEYAKILAPMAQLLGNDKEAAEAIRKLQQMRKHRKRPKPVVPTFPAVQSQIKGGSIFTGAAPPYDYDWFTGSGSSSVGTTSGGGFADKRDGSFSSEAQSHSGGGAWGAAGVGVYFRPLPATTLVRIGTYARCNYHWMDDSYGFSAHNDGSVGAYVQGWDLDGHNYRVELDQRPALWSNGTAGWEPTRSDLVEGANVPINEVYFPASSKRQYVVWILVSSSCDGTADRGGIITLGSQADNWISCNTPLILFEQF